MFPSVCQQKALLKGGVLSTDKQIFVMKMFLCEEKKQKTYVCVLLNSQLLSDSVSQATESSFWTPPDARV